MDSETKMISESVSYTHLLRNYNEELAVKTIQEIYARIENIQQFPYMGADLAKRVSFRTDYKYAVSYTHLDVYKRQVLWEPVI